MKMPFENGVSYYTKGKATIEIGFPENQIKCQYCRFIRYSDGLKRYSCRLTEEYLLTHLAIN
jgi:hypothetical protein